MFTEYETTVVLRPTLGGDAIESTLERMRGTISESGGKVLAINHWGKKKLAYEIDRQQRGIYVHTHFLGEGDLVAKMERDFRLSENVLRFLTVKMAEDVAAEAREAVDYVAPEYDGAQFSDEDPAQEEAAAAVDDDDDDDAGDDSADKDEE